MIKSMTGFGRCEQADENRKIVVEMKAVNHRYCDINVKLPKKLSFFESAVRSLMKKYIQRGKVDVYITYEDYTEHNVCLKYNKELAREYLEHLKAMTAQFGIADDVTVTSLARYPEVFTLEEQSLDEEELWKLLEEAVSSACERFVQTRIDEGCRLKEDLLSKLDSMLEKVAFIEERSPQIVAEYQQKLHSKVEELLGDSTIDEARILTEVTIFADKICVDEEIVRLKSHIENMKETLESGGSVGRKLDFIAQEMNREANTTLSKSNDLVLSNCAIDLKTEIEKVREQVQNIE
ncbi:MAG TPA: YicC family protein [Candidatus Scybalocola faecigallinarum]|uniref:YicC family protein n=1 Tax=Candidatus Scybalocola faecigallinarum TaxID=2840941 RepID=A0A9D1F2U8_9FIRM|nr:YicC family protein [Candidatus Scybalocola faecigallinarum]